MSAEMPAPVEPKKMLEELQSWWEVVSIAQYISLFRESFHLPEIEIEELENGLIEDSTNGPSIWLEDLICSLLHSALPHRTNKANWQVQLRKLVNRKCFVGQETPFTEDKSFSELSLRIKVEIIYFLCLIRLDRNDITEIMKTMDADALRVQKLGVDDSGNAYWYFYGTRLYKEEQVKEGKSWDEEWNKQKEETFRKKRRGRPKKIKILKSDGESDVEDDSKFMNVNEKSRWSVACDTLEQWIAFAANFQNSKSKNEKSLFQIIQENFLPTLSKIYEEKEKKIQQKLKELMPMREKIVTRRETRKLRGEVASPVVNGYAPNDESHKQFLAKDRARRLEERNRRLDEATANAEISNRKRPRYYDDSSEFDSSKDSDEYNYTGTPPMDEQKMDLQSQMERLMSSIKLHKDAWPFVYPVKEEEAPGYYEIIQKPVDLSSIASKLHEDMYETVGNLDADFSQMVSNCEMYNGENHPFSKMAQTLWTIFRQGVSKILDSIPPEELLNDDSEENSNSSDQVNKSPHTHREKRHKKEKEKKKNKKPARGMEALEMLAQASELAIQNNISPSPPQKLSPVPQSPQSQQQSHVVPSKKKPCYAPVTTTSPGVTKTSLPVTSSNFMPVQTAERNKPVIIQTKISQPSQVPNATTSLDCIPNISESYNSTAENNNSTFQTTGTRTVPIVFSNINSSNQSISTSKNQVPATVQSKICLPNSGIVQRILIPSGQQQIQLQNGQQFIITSPQGAANRVFSGSNQSSAIRQLNQGFPKVVPQMLTQAPVVQVSKDDLQRIQLAVSQNASQGFSQVAQNAQFVNIPTYVISNQNIQDQVQPTVMTMQQFQMAQAGQVQVNGQANG